MREEVRIQERTRGMVLGVGANGNENKYEVSLQLFILLFSSYNDFATSVTVLVLRLIPLFRFLLASDFFQSMY